MIQKECKGRLSLGKLHVAYVHDLVTSKNLALLREVPSWIPGRVLPLAAAILRVFSIFQDIPG